MIALAIPRKHLSHEVQLVHAGRLVPKLLEPDSNPLNILEFPVSTSAYASWKADSSAPDVSHSPIFIVGFPRSGTTLLEQMLDAHPGLRSMDERAFLQNVINRMQEGGKHLYPDDLGQLTESELADLRDTYWNCVREIVNLQEGERLVDKNPLNIPFSPMRELFSHCATHAMCCSATTCNVSMRLPIRCCVHPWDD